MRKLDLKVWEVFLIFLSAVFFTASVFIYVQDIPLRKYILGWQDTADTNPVGKLSKNVGSIKRKRAKRSEFESTKKGAVLYNFDTIVTPENGSALIVLDDGGQIELGPKTMVKLAFASEISIGGINRAARVEIVTGQVKARAAQKVITLKSRNQTIKVKESEPQKIINIAPPKPQKKAEVIKEPKPEPKPKRVLTKVVPVLPKMGTLFQPKNNQDKLQAVVQFQWKVNPPERQVLIQLVQMNGKESHRVLSKKIQPEKGIGKLKIALKKPGKYQWQLFNPPQGEKKPIEPLLKKNQTFSVSRYFDGIKLLEPLVGGSKSSSNVYSGKALKNFDITLGWRAAKGVKDFEVNLYKNQRGKNSIYQKKTNENNVTLNRKKVFTGKLFYRVHGKTKEGFIARSKIAPFRFDFLPPPLVLPKDRGTVRLKKGQKRAEVLFTWRTTNFTKKYEIQVSKNSNFETTTIKRSTRDNFFLLKGVSPGKYFWRVRSFGQGLYSAHSRSRSFQVKELPSRKLAGQSQK